MTTPVTQPQTQQQIVQVSHQNVVTIENRPVSHQFCPYCGSNTTSNVCPKCGQKID